MAQTTYTLAQIDKKQVKVGRFPKEEATYTYKSDVGGVIKFHAHPTKAWSWVIDETNDKSQKHVNKLINGFIDAGMHRGDKPFDEAIKVVNVS